jgi:hypothetical protein
MMPRSPTHDFLSYPLSPCGDTGDMPPPNIVQDNLNQSDFNFSPPYHHQNVPHPPQTPYPHYDGYHSVQSYPNIHNQFHYTANFPTQSSNHNHVMRNTFSDKWYSGASPLTSVVSMDYGPQEISTSCKQEEDRRQRKNTQARLRAAKLRSKVEGLSQAKSLSAEDEALLQTYEARRRRKNIRSRQRLLEKKIETERILNIPPHRRRPHEQKYLDDALKAKKKKNEGDRRRRQVIKQQKLGMERKTSGDKKSEDKKSECQYTFHKNEARSISPDSVKKPSLESSSTLMVAQFCVPVSPVSTMKQTVTRSDLSAPFLQSDYTNLDFPSFFKDH